MNQSEQLNTQQVWDKPANWMKINVQLGQIIVKWAALNQWNQSITSNSTRSQTYSKTSRRKQPRLAAAFLPHPWEQPIHLWPISSCRIAMDDTGSRPRTWLFLPFKLDLQSDMPQWPCRGWSLTSDESAHKPPKVKPNLSINNFSKIIQLIPKCKSPNVHSFSEVYLTYPASASSATITVFQAKGSQASSIQLKSATSRI